MWESERKILELKRYRATLDLKGFTCKFYPEKPSEKDNYITVTIFRGFHKDTSRFNEYKRGIYHLLHSMKQHLPGWRLLLFMTPKTFYEIDEKFHPRVTICTVDNLGINTFGI